MITGTGEEVEEGITDWVAVGVIVLDAVGLGGGLVGVLVNGAPASEVGGAIVAKEVSAAYNVAATSVRTDSGRPVAPGCASIVPATSVSMATGTVEVPSVTGLRMEKGRLHALRAKTRIKMALSRMMAFRVLKGIDILHLSCYTQPDLEGRQGNGLLQNRFNNYNPMLIVNKNMIKFPISRQYYLVVPVILP